MIRGPNKLKQETVTLYLLVAKITIKKEKKKNKRCNIANGSNKVITFVTVSRNIPGRTGRGFFPVTLPWGS